jgi:hypothetical protein
MKHIRQHVAQRKVAWVNKIVVTTIIFAEKYEGKKIIQCKQQVLMAKSYTEIYKFHLAQKGHQI